MEIIHLNILAVSEVVFMGTFLLGALVTIFWMYTGWRAMKAHEAIAKQAARANGIYAGSLETDGEVGDSMRERKRHFKRFLRDNPGVDAMNSKDRHERFREWLLDDDTSSQD